MIRYLDTRKSRPYFRLHFKDDIAMKRVFREFGGTPQLRRELRGTSIMDGVNVRSNEHGIIVFFTPIDGSDATQCGIVIEETIHTIMENVTTLQPALAV